MESLGCVEQDSVLCPVIGNLKGTTVIVTAILERTAVCALAGDKSGRKFVVNKKQIAIDRNKLHFLPEGSHAKNKTFYFGIQS